MGNSTSRCKKGDKVLNDDNPLMGIGVAPFPPSGNGLGITAHPYQQEGRSHYDESFDDSFNDSRDISQDVSQDLEDVDLMQEQVSDEKKRSMPSSSSSSYIPSSLLGNHSNHLSDGVERMAPSPSPSPSKRKRHLVKKASNSKSRRVKSSHRQYKPNRMMTTSASFDLPSQSSSKGGPFSIPSTKPLPHLHTLPRVSTSSEVLSNDEALEVIAPARPSTTRCNPVIAGHKRLTLLGSNEILEPPSSTRSNPVLTSTVHEDMKHKQRFSDGDALDFEWVGGIPKRRKKKGLFSRVKTKVKILMGNQKRRAAPSTKTVNPTASNNAPSRHNKMEETSSSSLEQHEENKGLTSSASNQDDGPDQFQLRGMGKLPTILDESYQSTTDGSVHSSVNPPNSNGGIAIDNNEPVDTTRVLDDLDESSQDQSDFDQSGDVDDFAQLLGLGGDDESDEQYSTQEESIDASRDYSVVTEEVDDLKPTFSSCHKPPLNRSPPSQTMEDGRNVDNTYSNSYFDDLLDRAHGSYVEGQKDSRNEVQTPDVQLRLGHLFADMTMNQSRSRYHHLETPEHETPSVAEKVKTIIDVEGQVDENILGMTELLEESCDGEDAPHILLKDCQGAPISESFFIKIPEDGNQDYSEEDVDNHAQVIVNGCTDCLDQKEDTDDPESDTADKKGSRNIDVVRGTVSDRQGVTCDGSPSTHAVSLQESTSSVKESEKDKLSPLSNEDTSKPVESPYVESNPENGLKEITSSTTPLSLDTKPTEEQTKERKLTPMFQDKEDGAVAWQNLKNTNLLPEMQSDEDSYTEELNVLTNKRDESQLAATKSKFLVVLKL